MFNMARASFTTLPNEMLISIARLSDCFRDFSSLARVNRHAYGLLDICLLRHKVSMEEGRSATLVWALTAAGIDEEFRLLMVNKAIHAGVDVDMGISLAHFPDAGIPRVNPAHFLDKNNPRRNHEQLKVSAVGIGISRGYFRVAHRMLEAGADINLELSPDVSPLSESVETQNTDAVNFILTQPGTDVDQRQPKGDTILERALTFSTAEIVQLIVSHVDMSRREYSGGIQIFLLAMQSQNPEMMSAVLSSEHLSPNYQFVTNINRRNPDTVFTFSCTMSDGGIVRVLHDDDRVDVDFARDGYNLGVLNAWKHRRMNHVKFLMRSNKSKTAKGSIFCLAYYHGNVGFAKGVLRLACAEVAANEALEQAAQTIMGNSMDTE